MRRHWLPWLLAGSAAGLVVAAPARAETPLVETEYRLDDPRATLAQETGAEEQLSLSLSDADRSALASLGDAEASRRFTINEEMRLSFGDQAGSVKWEMAGALAYMTALNIWKMSHSDLTRFKFIDEGFFGKDTSTLGVDKMVHAHNAYMLSELIGARIRKNTGTTRGTAISGALLATGLMLYNEVYDGFKGGFSVQDLAFNALGAGFSVLRNTAGLEDKLDFRFLLIPTGNIYEAKGKEHYRQVRHLLALKLAGFGGLDQTPLRFVELHVGYYAKGFTDEEVERGIPRRRKIFFGVGVNLSQLLFGRSPGSHTARAASQLFDYWQPPYTYVHAD